MCNQPGIHLLFIALPEKMVKRIFAIVLFWAAIKMLAWDAAVMKWIKSIF